MTQYPGQNDPEDENRTPGEATGSNSEGSEDVPKKQEQTPEAPHGDQPTRPIGSNPAEPQGPGYGAPSHTTPGQPARPGQPGSTTPGQPGQGPYGQSGPSAQQPPSSGSAPSGYGYGQQSGGYSAQSGPGSAPGQPGQYQPGQYGAQNQPGQGGPQYQGQYPGGQYQQQYPQQYPQSPVPPKKSNSVEGKNFFAALFDFSFQSFVTVKFAKFIYAILIIFIALGYLFVVISAFITDPAVGLLALLLGWIPAMIYLIVYRVTLEFVIALVRTSQNTAGTRAEIEALRADLKNRS